MQYSNNKHIGKNDSSLNKGSGSESDSELSDGFQSPFNSADVQEPHTFHSYETARDQLHKSSEIIYTNFKSPGKQQPLSRSENNPEIKSTPHSLPGFVSESQVSKNRWMSHLFM